MTEAKVSVVVLLRHAKALLQDAVGELATTDGAPTEPIDDLNAAIKLIFIAESSL